MLLKFGQAIFAVTTSHGQEDVIRANLNCQSMTVVASMVPLIILRHGPTRFSASLAVPWTSLKLCRCHCHTLTVSKSTSYSCYCLNVNLSSSSTFL